MTHQQARRRFTTILIVSMALFVAVSLGLAWAGGAPQVPPVLSWLLAAIAVVALLTPLWAQWSYLGGIDEYLRSLELRAIFAGLVTILLVASGWGYVELYLDGARLQMYWLNPLYWIVYSIAHVAVGLRESRPV